METTVKVSIVMLVAVVGLLFAAPAHGYHEAEYFVGAYATDVHDQNVDAFVGATVN